MLYPCDVGTHRASGPQATIYPAVADGVRADRRKLRVCTGHFPELRSRIEQYAVPAQQSLIEQLQLKCIECGEDALDATWQFFVTVYAVGEDRADYWTLVHDGCREATLARWHLPE